MNGILLVDKPSDWTSNDVVCKLRGVFHERRIGHSGTLDPMATGLLVVFIGKATKAVEFSEAQVKTYRAELRLGFVTDTQDITGNVLSENPVNVSYGKLEETVNGFKGEIFQIPPMYSAIKINGERLYNIARTGREVERKARPIIIHDIDIESFDGVSCIFTVTCSKGTYIRTLCHDIGQALGCGACMSSLRRLSCGNYSIDNAMTLNSIIQCVDADKLEELLLPVDSVFNDLECIQLDKHESERIRNGMVIGTNNPDGRFRVYDDNHDFLSLCLAESGKLKVIKNFYV